MKDFFKEIFDSDTTLTVFIALLLGIFIGVFFQTGYFLGIRTFFHNMYVKIFPEIHKDSKTIIMERVTKDVPNLPQKDIFEEPQKKENGMVLFIKRFVKKEQKSPSINEVILN